MLNVAACEWSPGPARNRLVQTRECPGRGREGAPCHPARRPGPRLLARAVGAHSGPILPLRQDALIDTVKKSKLHFVHCFLPVAEGWAGEPRSAASRRVSSSSELDLPPGEHCEAGGLLPLDVPLLRAQLRGSRLLGAMRMYRQGGSSPQEQPLALLPSCLPPALDSLFSVTASSGVSPCSSPAC